MGDLLGHDVVLGLRIQFLLGRNVRRLHITFGGGERRCPLFYFLLFGRNFFEGLVQRLAWGRLQCVLDRGDSERVGLRGRRSFEVGHWGLTRLGFGCVVRGVVRGT